MMSRLAASVVLAIFLAGCSSDQDESALASSVQVLGSLKQAIVGRRAGPAPKVQLTAEQRASFDKPVLQVNPETFGGSDFLGLRTTRTDSGLGKVNVWNSSDNAQLFLRNGVIVGSRGIGGDIISANADVTIKALRAQAGRTGVRTYIISDGDVTTTEYTFRCTIGTVKAEALTLYNQRYNTSHMREDCVGGPDGDKVLRNEYWVQQADGFVRKSRQWVGPRIGYFEVIAVKR